MKTEAPDTGTRRGEKRAFLSLIALAVALNGMAAQVHVLEKRRVNGVDTLLSDVVYETSTSYSTRAAPAVDGYIFTHWTSTSLPFSGRDRHNRARDLVSAVIYEETTFTANYRPAEEDTDGDGIADGYELYWYGGLDQSADSDTDGDGRTFAEELAAGTDPLMPDRSLVGGIVWSDGGLQLYNPSNLCLSLYVVRSEPEGALFATTSDFVEPGTVITTPKCSTLSSEFAYWSVDGVRMADRRGRAKDSVSFTVPSNGIEVVAVCESDLQRRRGLYWYGDADADADSDTDGDGRTFAEELAAGTDPLMPDRSIDGGIVWADGDLRLYNPSNLCLCTYVIRSEPEGALFATISDTVEPGTSIKTPSCNPSSSEFAYWTVDGVRMTDQRGRAKDSVTFMMPSNDVEAVAVCEGDVQSRNGLYWYGDADADIDSDTDGDGRTFIEELAAGTDPLMPDRSLLGGIVWADGKLLEADLQVYEQATGAVVDGRFTEMFTSALAGNEGTSMTFGANLQPIVWDMNGDGLFDLVLVYDGGCRTFINVGHKGNPEFAERTDMPMDGVDLAMNDSSRLAEFDLDIYPVDALSATTNGTTLLASDAAGRIWCYSAESSLASQDGEVGSVYQLQHKVWGGSYAGFANGLRLAAVDWDDDGDLDCLAGTAEGKLMLLRDPQAGCPVGLKAEAGVDTVVLAWDPNRQSQIRGYRVYRASVDSGLSLESAERIADPSLPTYRDAPPEIASYDYMVSSVSRFYTPGNSTPTITESPKTAPVRASLGNVRFFWNDANAKLGEQVEVSISIENALNYNVAGRSQSITYDPDCLRPVRVVKSGLTDGIALSDAAQDGVWTVTMSGGNLPAGSGRFLTFVFDTLREGTSQVGGATVTVASAGAACYFLGDVDGNGELTKADLQLLAILKDAAVMYYTDEQLKAGDFNGNGKLDNADYQALRELLREKDLL